MKTQLIIILLFVIPILVFSQNNNLDNIHGLSMNGNEIYEISGYTIMAIKNKGKFQEKDIKKIKKKYELKNISSEYSDENIDCENLVIESTNVLDKKFPNLISHQLCYILPFDDKELMVILFQRMIERDTELEQTFIKAYFNKKLSQHITNIDDWAADSINFAGRTIALGNPCRWMSPNNVQCRASGQMSWSTFNTLEEAQLDNKALLSKKELGGSVFKFLSEKNIDIKFEGIPTIAKRMVYKIKGPKFFTGNYNILVIYYVVQKVRNNFVSCVLSYYTDNENDYKLAPLLQEVMTLTSQN